MTEDDSSLIAFCGLCCKDCFAYKGTIADLARDLRKELRESKFDKTAEFMSQYSFFNTFKYYSECYDVLGAIVKLRCKKGCKSGGGPPFCNIRKCCQKKNIEGCWECDDFNKCNNLDFLKPSHGDAHLRNLRRLKAKSVKEFLTGKRDWYTPIKSNG